MQNDHANDKPVRQQIHQPCSLTTKTMQNIDHQNLNRWSDNLLETNHSPIILTDKAPVTINYKTRPGGTQPAQGFRGFSPIIMSCQGKVTVNYEIAETCVPSAETPPLPNTGKDLCLLADTMVQTPSGVMMPYLKFKMISSYLSEALKSDVRIILDNKNMSYKQFQETLRVYGCNDVQDDDGPESTTATGFVTLSDGVTHVKTDDYKTIVISVINGLETLIVPGVFSAKYSTHRSLLTDQLPELIPSAFVATPAADEVITPFSLYRAVEKDLVYQKPTSSSPSSVDRIDHIRWHDGKIVDVQTVRNVIDALRNPEKISYVLSNGKRVPFIEVSKKESPETYDCAKDKILMDIGCGGKLVPLLVFSDIATAVGLPDGTYNRFKPVFENDMTQLLTDNYNGQDKGQTITSRKSDTFANNVKEYNTNLIHVVNKHTTENQLNGFRSISAIKNSTGLNEKDNMGTYNKKEISEICIADLIGNVKPLIYNITYNPIDSEYVKHESQNKTDFLPYLSMTNLNTTDHRVTITSQTNTGSIEQPVTINNKKMKNTFVTNNTTGTKHINYNKELTENNFAIPKTFTRNSSNNETKHLSNNNLKDNAGKSIHVLNRRSINNKLNDSSSISPMEKSIDLDNNGSIIIRISSQEGTNEICISNLFNNAPLRYAITDKPINLQDTRKNMSLTTSYLNFNNSHIITKSLEQPIIINIKNRTTKTSVANNITNINKGPTKSDIFEKKTNYTNKNLTTTKHQTIFDEKSRKTDNILGITGSEKILTPSLNPTTVANISSNISKLVPGKNDLPTFNDNKNSIENINHQTEINQNNKIKFGKTKTDINERPSEKNKNIEFLNLTITNHDSPLELSKNTSDSKINSVIEKQSSMSITSNTTKFPECSLKNSNKIPGKKETIKINDDRNFLEATNTSYTNHSNGSNKTKTISNENHTKNNNSETAPLNSTIVNSNSIDKNNSQTNLNRVKQPVTNSNSTVKINTSNTNCNVISTTNNFTKTNVRNNGYNETFTKDNTLVNEKSGGTNNNSGITGCRNSSMTLLNTINIPESNTKNLNATNEITEVPITNNNNRYGSKTIIENPSKMSYNNSVTAMMNNPNYSKTQNNSLANTNSIKQPITISDNNETINNSKVNSTTVKVETIHFNDGVSITENTTLTKDKSKESNNINGTTGILNGTKVSDNNFNDSSKIPKTNETFKVNYTEGVDNPKITTSHSTGLKNESCCIKTDNKGNFHENNDTETKSTGNPTMINLNILNTSKKGNNSQTNTYKIGQPITIDNNNGINTVVINSNNCNVEPTKKFFNTNNGDNNEISILTGNTTIVDDKPADNTGTMENENNTVTSLNATKIPYQPLDRPNETPGYNEMKGNQNYTGERIINPTLQTHNYKKNNNGLSNIADTDVGKIPRENNNAKMKSTVNTIIVNQNQNKRISTNFDDILEKIILPSDRSVILNNKFGGISGINNTAMGALNYIFTSPNNNSIINSDSKIVNIIVY